MRLFSLFSTVLYFFSVFLQACLYLYLQHCICLLPSFCFCFPSFALSLILCTSYTKHTLYKPNSHLGLPNKCHVLEALHLTYFSCCRVSVSHSGPLLEIPPSYGPKLHLVQVFLQTSALFASLSKRRHAKLRTNCVIDPAQIRFPAELNNKDII